MPQVQPTRGKRRPALTTFRELGVFPETADALDALGITEAFPIQEMTLPVALSGADVIGQAKTGTGKTLGFGIPLLQRIIAPDDADEVDLAAPDARRRSSSSRPASCASRSPTTCARPAAPAACGCWRSTAAAPTSRRSRPCTRASTSSSAPPAG